MIAKIFLHIANRMHLIVVTYIFSLCTAALLFAYLENKTLMDGIWWATVTSLTIGYGDLYPTTTVGRIIGIIFGHIWIFAIIPMVVANIMTRLLIDNNCFTDAEQVELFNRLDNLQQTVNSVVDKKI